MEGMNPISMLLIVSVMFVLVTAHEEESFEEKDFSFLGFSPDQAAPLPPETPLSPGFPFIPGTPYSPESPQFPGNPLPIDTPVAPKLSCEAKCALNCFKMMLPLLTNKCLQVCNMKCGLLHSESLYDCTNSCAQSIPAGLMYDKEKTESYVNSCYKKCTKND